MTKADAKMFAMFDTTAVIAMFDSVRTETEMSAAKRAGDKLHPAAQLLCVDAAIGARRRLRAAMPTVADAA